MKIVGALLFTLLLCIATYSDDKSNERAVRDLLVAFNQHDVAAMLKLVTDDIKWISAGDAKIEIETDGKAALEKSMTGYFKSCPSCRSEFESVTIAGSRVVTYEKAMWRSKAGRDMAQRSLAVYELRDGLISRVWYFPVEK